jgi:hypothetical protein
MVLGPAAECCLLATEEIVVPGPLEARVVTVELAWLKMPDRHLRCALSDYARVGRGRATRTGRRNSVRHEHGSHGYVREHVAGHPPRSSSRTRLCE